MRRSGLVGSTAVVAALALLVPASPARAQTGAVVHTWFEGPAAATAGGPAVELKVFLRFERGDVDSGFLTTRRIDIELTDPAGQRSTRAETTFGYFADWRPTPVDNDRTYEPEQDHWIDLRVRFAAGAPAGVWRIRARVTEFYWSMNGFELAGTQHVGIDQRNRAYEIRVAGRAGGGVAPGRALTEDPARRPAQRPAAAPSGADRPGAAPDGAEDRSGTAAFGSAPSRPPSPQPEAPPGASPAPLPASADGAADGAAARHAATPSGYLLAAAVAAALAGGALIVWRMRRSRRGRTRHVGA